MRCGNCHGDHEAVEEVRACYGSKILAGVAGTVTPSATEPNWNRAIAQSASRTPVPQQLFPTPEPITAKQEAFLNKLLAERPGFRDIENLWPDRVATFTKAMASAKIKETLEVEKEINEKHWEVGADLTSLLEGVDDGYFAIPSKSGNNDLDFFRIGSNQGRVNPANKGQRRISRYLGGQGLIDIRISEQIEFAKLVVALSEEERKSAMATFGREIGRCGCCGKSLTDEISRAEGIGPVCRGR